MSGASARMLLLGGSCQHQDMEETQCIRQRLLRSRAQPNSFVEWTTGFIRQRCVLKRAARRATVVVSALHAQRDMR